MPAHLPFAGIIPERASESSAAMPEVQFDGRSYKEIIKDMEGVVLQAAMRKYGNIANIAKELAVDRSTIFRKIKELEKKGVRFD
jgi:transcriptional regulator with PAS, ATPase and Fis domain